MAEKANILSNTKWMCKYRIVFSPKYRRKVIIINIGKIWKKYFIDCVVIRKKREDNIFRRLKNSRFIRGIYT